MLPAQKTSAKRKSTLVDALSLRFMLPEPVADYPLSFFFARTFIAKSLPIMSSRFATWAFKSGAGGVKFTFARIV